MVYPVNTSFAESRTLPSVKNHVAHLESANFICGNTYTAGQTNHNAILWDAIFDQRIIAKKLVVIVSHLRLRFGLPRKWKECRNYNEYLRELTWNFSMFSARRRCSGRFRFLCSCYTEDCAVFILLVERITVRLPCFHSASLVWNH